MKLEKLLSHIYPVDDAKQAYDLVHGYELSAILQIAIDKTDYFIGIGEKEEENRIVTNIGGLASSFLSGINSKLVHVTTADEKRKIELIVSDVAFELIKNILDNFSGDGRLLLNAIHESVRMTCDFNGYDFNIIEQLIPFAKYIAMQPSSDNRMSSSPLVHVYYKWNSNKYNLNSLSETLKSKKIIKRVRDFHMLFESPRERFTICFNSAYHDELIVLFDMLYAKEHISPVGTKGHFVPLKSYAVDLGNQSLIKKQPKTIKYTLKKNKRKWSELNSEVGKWIASFK